MGEGGQVDLVPILTAIAATVGGLATIVKALPRLRRLGAFDSRECARQKAELKVEAEVWQEKHNVVAGERDAARQELGTVRTELASALMSLDFERRAGAQCRSDLDDVRSEVRAMLRAKRT